MHAAPRILDRAEDVPWAAAEVVVFDDDVRPGRLVQGDSAAVRIERLLHASILPADRTADNCRLESRP